MTTMPTEDEEFDGELIDEFLRHLRGRGPEIDHLPDQQASLERLFQLLEAIVDDDEIEIPAIEDDPVALRLGIVSEKPEKAIPGSGDVATTDSSPIAAALAELAYRFQGEVEFVADDEVGGSN
jgi:hypothetical protein